MLIPEQAQFKLLTIEQLLEDFEAESLINVASDSGSFLPVDNGQNPKEPIESHFLDRLKKLEIISPTSSAVFIDCDDGIEVYSDNWIKLRGKDLEVFNKLDHELLVYNNQETFKKALCFLLASIQDYPPEFFLQPPNMLETLMDILWKVPTHNGVEIIKIMHFILNGLKDRWIESKSKKSCYIPIKKHMNKIIQIFTVYFERFHDEFDNTHLVTSKQEILNAIYNLLFDMVGFIKESQDFCEIFLNELMNMMAKVVKDFRIADSKSSLLCCRINYLVLLYLINAFLSSVDTSNILQFCLNNVWEYECDIALLDFRLKTKHEKIYSLIMKNRIEVIKEDRDLELLLNIETLWKPAVQCFQNYEKLSEKYIIENASKAIDVIRILKNPNFVDVVFKAIFDSSYRFHVDTNLKNESEAIFLRLLSIDSPEIKLRTYKLSRESIQKRISEDANNPKEVDLCSVVGFPCNTEIITEIICFGLLDNDMELQKHATMILFAILRGKVIFPNHWEVILEVLRPVLAMMPCLFAKEPKLGFFAFDIYNQHSGFSKDELNQAYARFLFCTHPNPREMAKRKLLENLEEYKSDFIEIVPDNFCILNQDQISELSIPERHLGYDREAYQTTAQLLKSESTHSDPEILKSILLRLSVLMNSAKLCQESHDDNLWIYFMASLDMNFPRNLIIRKLTINILYKWAITIPSFRIYLANEPKALQFIINTLIYYQDEPSIKKQASTFLFLILFSDFVVVNDNVTSLPNILSTLECPFRFSKHWEESPFNKISQIEWLYESMEKDDDRDSDIREITQKYFKFTFSNAWQQSSLCDFNGNFYGNKNALKVPEKILLNEKEFKELKEFSIPFIVESLTNTLANLTTTGEMTRLIQQVICALLLPNMNIEKLSPNLDKHLIGCGSYKANYSKPRKVMFIKLMELYEHIIPFLSESRIVGILRDDSVHSILFSSQLIEDQEVLIQVLKLTNTIIKLCKDKKDLPNKIIKRYNDEAKVNFSSHLIEKLITNFIENFVKCRLLHDVQALPVIKMILTTIKNTLNYFPMVLDEPFINAAFHNLLTTTKVLLRPSSTFNDNSLKNVTHCNTHVVYLMHSIIERLASLSCQINLKPDNFNMIFLWISDHERRDNSMIWKIVALLTKKNQHCINFCKGFEEEMKMSFYDIVFQIITNNEKKFSSNERNAQALVIGNLLDHICESNMRELGMKNCRKTAMEIKEDLARIFIDQKPNNIDAICFLIKKMLNNNMMYVNNVNIYNVTEIVKHKRLVEFLIKNSIENLDTVVDCYRYKELEKYTLDILCGIKDETLYHLISKLRCPYEKSPQYSKRINKNLLGIIFILLQSKDGHEKAYKVISKDQATFNIFVMIIFNGMQSENPFGEIMFHLGMLYSLLNHENEFFSNQVSNLVSGDSLNVVGENFAKFENNSLESFVKNNLKNVQYAVELFMLQIIALFDNIDSMRFNSESKYIAM